MFETTHQNSSTKCFRGLRDSTQQNRVSAELFKETSKTLFITSGLSQLRVLHNRQKNSDSIKNGHKHLSSLADTLVDEEFLEHDYIGIPLEEPNDQLEIHSGRSYEIPDVEELDRVLALQTQFNGYVISQDGSWHRLELTHFMYEAFRARLGIPDTFNDAIMYMGYREHEIEIAPPPLKWQAIRIDLDSDAATGWQCSLMLRYVQLNYRDTGHPWSLRQFAVYNHCDVINDSCTSVFVAPPDGIVDDYHEVYQENNSNVNILCVSLQIKILRTTLAYWRPYIVWVASELAQYSLQITFGDPIRRRLVDIASDDTGEGLRALEGNIDDAILSLEANKHTAFSLCKMWRQCRIADQDRELDAIVNELHTALDTHILQLQNLRQKAKRSARTVSNYRDLASGVFLQNNGKSLEQLAIAAQADNVAATALTKQMQEDASAVKALTLLALIYLPISVVLNFFSTSLIDVSDTAIRLAPHWWLFLAIGLPLTIFTLSLWQVWIFLKKERPENTMMAFLKAAWGRCFSKSRTIPEKSVV